jgi:hypothetical protein
MGSLNDWKNNPAPGFNPNDPLYETTTIEEENKKEEEQVKDELRAMQQQSIDASIHHRFISNQIVSSTGIPTLKPHKQTKDRWFGAHNAQGAQPGATDSNAGLSSVLNQVDDKANASGGNITPPPQPAVTQERHVKNHKIATESKGRFEAICDKLASFFPKKEANKDADKLD